MAMDAYKKAADGGNCLAMTQIGELYSKGNGVAADKTSAQSWQAKAESCQGGNVAFLQQQLAQFRARFAAAREPMLAAIPVIQKSTPPVARNGHRSGVSGNSDVLASIVIAVAVVGAIAALIPDSPANVGTGSLDDRMGQINRDMNDINLGNWRCVNSGGTIGITGNCPQ